LKIEEIRPSFTVYVIASEPSRVEGLAESLGLAGYMVANFKDLSSAFSEVFSNPPHFVLFDAQEASFKLSRAIKQVVAQLPESHILIVTPIEEREKTVPMLEAGVYDLILTPLTSQVELVRALDRAAERDYFMYLNERLSEGQILGGDASPPDGPRLSEGGELAMELNHETSFASELFQAKSSDEAISAFMRAASAAFGHCPVLFFKYIANRRVLMAGQAHKLDGFDLNGLGINFNEVNSNFRASQLRDPHGVNELQAIMAEVFNASEFVALPVEALGEIQGLVVLLRNDPDPAGQQKLQEWVFLLSRALSLVEAEKRLHSMAIKDPSTDLLNKANFIIKVRDEISRARRTNMAVSLATIAVDQYGQMVAKIGQEEAQTILKMVARIFEKHSRVNDVIGRTGPDEFGIVLPHTGKQGALIKAERLRMIIESADFSRVLKAFPEITVSIGVAEYPSMVRDAEELMQLADEALFQVRSKGNKTCVAKPPEGFKPDFEVREKGM
jgi:diguanylate cyclase (GGDEF)-like protein